MKKKISSLLSLLILMPYNVSAESYGNITGDIATIPEFIHALIMLLVKLGVPVAAISIVWAGFQFVLADGDAKKMQSAKSALLWSCIGFAVLITAWVLSAGILNTLMDFGGSPGE